MIGTILHVGENGAKVSSRRHALRVAGFDVIAARPDDVLQLARQRAADVIVLEAGVLDAEALKRALLADPATARCEVIDLASALGAALPQRAPQGGVVLAAWALLRMNETEQALRESDARFNSIADAAPVLIWMTGIDRALIYLNLSSLQFTGTSLAQELRAGWFACVHAVDRAASVATYDSAFSSRSDFEMEYRLLHHSGEFRWVLNRGVPRYTPDGIFAGYIGTCIDIDERKRTEQALRESETTARARAEELEAFMDIAPVGIWIAHDPQCHHMSANRAAYEILRQSPGTTVTATPADGSSPFTFKVRNQGLEIAPKDLAMQRAARTGVEADEDVQLVFADGLVSHIVGRAVPLRDAHGNVRGSLGAFVDITERKQMEAALQSSEEQLQLALGAAEVGLWLWNLQLDEMIWSARTRTLFGVAPETPLTPPVFQNTVHPADRDQVRSAITAAIKTGAEFDMEFRVVHPNASVHWIAARGRVRYSAQATPSHMTGVVLDITPRKRAEEALRASEQRFRSLIEHSNDLISISDGGGRLQYVSSSVERILGYQPEVYLRADPLLLTHPEDAPKVHQLIQDVLAYPSELFNIQYRVQHGDGGWRWIEGTVMNQLNDPVIHGVVGNFRDITERKEAEAERERLLTSEVILREMAEENEARSAFLSEISEAMAATLSYRRTLHEVAQKAVPLIADCCIIELLHGADTLEQVACACADPTIQAAFAAHAQVPLQQAEQNPLAQALRSGKTIVIDKVEDSHLRALAADADQLEWYRRLHPAALFIVPMVAYGDRIGVLSFILSNPQRYLAPRDVSLAQEMANRIALSVRNSLLFADAERARTSAEEANRVKDEFLATVSHELRQPVHAIGGWVRLLKTGKLSEEKAARALDTIDQNVTLQGQIVNDLLDVSAMITGQLRLDVQTVALPSVIESAVETMRPAADAKNIELVVQLDYSIGALAGDPSRLQQVVWNLLSNAVKFTPRGGRIEVMLARADDDAQIIVRDNGPGIEPNFLPYVFDRFRQQDSTTTRRFGGLGLGLAIVRNVVELHGGTVEVGNNGSNGGAVFVLHLPLVAQAPQRSAGVGA
ncbi:MAG: PAS domain S-box protein [Betaproteobacteria bacterium]